MSSRFYPMYQKGNPQIRIFLPNFWMKLIKPKRPQPQNVVCFDVQLQMSKHDVKNYLKKIYQLPVVDVKTQLILGEFYRDRMNGAVMKKDDRRIAFVTLPREVEFTYPELFPSEAEDKKKIEEDSRALDDSKTEFKKFLHNNKERKGLPGWFSF